MINFFIIMRKYLLIYLTFFCTVLYGQYSTECDVLDSNEEYSNRFEECQYYQDLTKDQILALPEFNVSVVFHFISDNNQNFTCDENDPIVSINELLYVPSFSYYFMNKINNLLDSGVEVNGEMIDTRIRVDFANADACSSSYFVDNWSDLNLVDGVTNVIFQNRSGGGWAGPGNFRRVGVNSILESFLSGSINWWSPAQTFVHEFGHTLNLDHTFYCDNPCGDGQDYYSEDHCYGQCVGCQFSGCGDGCFGGADEYFMAYTDGRVKFGLCEYTRMMNHIINADPPSIQHCNNDRKQDEIVISDGNHHIWSGLKRVNASIHLKNNSTLELNCANVEVKSNEFIIVERGSRLIVDDSKISSNCSSSEWKGILVEGNGTTQPLDPLSQLSSSDAGVVLLRNDAVIENARTGITCQKLGEDWNSDYYGGLIVAEDATFLNCGRGVAFMPYSRDLSSFTDVTFECEGTGVTAWNNHGVVYQECTFSGLSDSGLYGEDATMNIQNNCLFNDNNHGVYLDYSYQPISHSNRIGHLQSGVGNEFRENKRDLKFSGSAHDNFIYNNQSWGASKFSIDMDGLSEYTIQGNSYFSTKDKSVRLYSTGGSTSIVDENEFVDHAHGIGVFGYNEGTSFDLNCFSDAGVADIFVTQSDFANNIGNPATSAGNCFSNSPSAFNFIAYGTNAAFTYWEPDPTEGDACLIPTDLSDQFTDKANDPSANYCTGFSGFTDGEADFCKFDLNVTNMDSMVTAIELSIQDLEIDSTRSYQEELDLKRFKLCLDKALSEYVDSLVISGDCDKAFALYDRQLDDALRIKAYSVLLDCDKCQEAGLWLANFETENSELQDYTAVQQINIKRLCNRRDFEPTEGELYHLYGLTQQTHPYSAYARSLWHILTGESIFLPMPTIEKSVDKRSDSSVTSKWSLYPNPTSEQLTITFDRLIESGEIMITDNLGRCVDDSNITAQNLHRIDVTQYDSGIYYVRVSVNDRLEYIDKFVVK